MSDEYIKREDALNALREYPVTKLKTAIRRLPSADVAPVVRCKDCKWWDYSEGEYSICCAQPRNIYGVAKDGSDFCSWGERENNE